MNKEEQIKKREIDTLKSEIEYHNNIYYNKDSNEISDLEYDKKLNTLIELENKFPHLKTIDSPSQRIGGTITKKFESIKHNNPMLSLSNTYSEAELIEFDKRIKKNLPNENIQYTCELKYDGVALSLIYENRILKYALTRGDGKKGDNITNNVYTIKSIPIKLPIEAPDFIEVRGEVFISKNDFKKLNTYRKNNNESIFSNPRNLASGSLKMQDSSEVSKRNLNCYIYSLNTKLNSIRDHYQALNFLKKLNYNVPDSFKKCNSIKEVISYIEYWENERNKIDVETDGIVIKVNNLEQQKKLGVTSKNPRWAVAFKYKSEDVKTSLKKIRYQVGRTGAITPVAILKPVKLSGSTVKRASLHNFNEIKRLDLRIGDTIIIEKGGEIIPKITGVDISKRPNNTNSIEYISFCPSCNYPLSKKKNEANHYCENYNNCLPQIQGRIEHFIGKDAMNIEHLGPETIKGLIDNKLINNPSDLYDLNFNKLYKLNIIFKNSDGEEKTRRLKEKSCENILKSIKKSKDTEFSNILFGLGIRYVGKRTAELLTQNFKSIDDLIRTEYNKIIDINEIGEKIAVSVTKFFQEKDNILLISKLKSVGLKFYNKEKINYNAALNNLKFVISGTFKGYSRNELKKIITRNGGKVSSSISKKTNFIVAGKNIGPSKKLKAENLNINIISEIDFDKMINQ